MLAGEQDNGKFSPPVRSKWITSCQLIIICMASCLHRQKGDWSSGYWGLVECAFAFSTVVFRLLHYISVGKLPRHPMPHVQTEQADINQTYFITLLTQLCTCLVRFFKL